MIVLLALCPALAPAGEPTDTSFACDQPELIGLVTGLNDPLALTIDGDYAYIAQNDNSLLIIDISDPQFPTLLANADDLLINAHNETRITINQSAAYIDGLIVNIEDKTDPWFVRYGATNLPVIDNSYIYPENFNGAFNVTRPLSLGLDRFVNPAFEFNDDIAAVINGQLVTLGLDRYDITNPLDPQLIDDNPYEPGSIDSWRYDEPYIIVDERTTTDPIIHTYQEAADASTTTTLAGVVASDLTVRADIVFALNEGLHIYTLSSEPMLIASYTDDPILSDARFIRRLGDHFLIVTSNTLAIYDIRTNPIAGVSTNSHTSFLELVGNTAVLSSGTINSTRLAASVVDTSTPTEPRWIADLPVADPFGLASSQQTVFVAGKQEGLLAFDLSNASQPELRATYNTSTNQAGNSNTRDVFIMGAFAYVADRNSGLTIYTIGPDQVLTPLSTRSLPQATQRVRVQGNLAFVSTIRALFLVDISNPELPSILSSIDKIPGADNYIHTAVMHEQLLYTADSNEGYRIFDISDVSNPVELAHFTLDDLPPNSTATPEVFDLSIRSNLLYVAASRRGIAVYENSNPFNPILIRHTEPNADVATTNNSRYRDLAFRDNLLFTSAGNAGIRIYDLNDCAGPCPIDFNTDGVVDFFDVAVFLAAFGMHEPLADLEPDGEFNFFDVAAFIALYHAGCP